MSNMKLIMENWRKVVKKDLSTLREGSEALSFDEKENNSKSTKYLKLFKNLHPKYGQPKDVAEIFKKAMKMQLVKHPEGMGSKWQENDKLSSESEEVIDRIAQELKSNIEPIIEKHRENPHPYGRQSNVSELDELNAEVKKHIEKALKELENESEV